MQGAVAAKRLGGQSKSQIARDLGISRNTVDVILSETELSDLVKQAKSGVHGLLPKAVRTYDRLLDKDNERVATQILQGTHVLETSADRPTVANNIRLVILNASNRPPRVPPSDNGHEPTNGDSSIQ